MKKAVKIMFGALMASGVVACVVGLKNSYYKHTEPPPGWSLATNKLGEYAPLSPDGYAIDMAHEIDKPLRLSRQAAINRAWAQYEYEKEYEERKSGWVKETVTVEK